MTVTRESGRTLTRAALREAVYSRCSVLSRAEVSRIFEEVVEEICATLSEGETVSLRAFGSFWIRSKRGRTGRNPKTGVEAPITARKVLSFRPSRVLVARVNGGSVAFEEEKAHSPPSRSKTRVPMG
jgi:integration host factor subunit alpha